MRSLYSVITDDVTSTTESNIRPIMLETGVDEWSIPLLRNLLEVRNDNWEVIFDEETGKAPTDDELDFMIAAVCSG